MNKDIIQMKRHTMIYDYSPNEYGQMMKRVGRKPYNIIIRNNRYNTGNIIIRNDR